MTISAKAERGLNYGASVAGVPLEAYKDQVLENEGMNWADQAEKKLAADRLAVLDAKPDLAAAVDAKIAEVKAEQGGE